MESKTYVLRSNWKFQFTHSLITSTSTLISSDLQLPIDSTTLGLYNTAMDPYARAIRLHARGI